MKFWLIGKKGLLAKSFAHFFQKQKLPVFQTSQEEVDITQKEEVKKVFERKRPEVILNCSALAEVDKAEQRVKEAFLINKDAVGYLGELSQKYEGKVIHFSTDYVFDGQKKTPYTEEDVCNPINQYGLSKREGEKLLLEANPHSLVLRTAWLFGRGEKGFFQNLERSLNREKQIKMVSDKRGSPTFCEDLVKTTFLLLQKEGIFHVVNQGTASRYEMALFFLSFFSKRKKFFCERLIPAISEEFSGLAKRPEYSVLSIQKLQKETGLYLRDWKEALTTFLQQGR